LIPRSYDKEVPEGKTEAFKMTSFHCKEFGTPNIDQVMTHRGKETMHKNIQEFNVSYRDSNITNKYYSKLLSREDKKISIRLHIRGR
jgi:hypothetical protein